MQESNSVSISIVIPVYNSELYLSQCLESILSQTFQDFEIICIDDGSMDDSLSLLEQYAKHDNRIHVLTQQHQNVGVAWNVGLEIAQGEYIIFLDSDDFFSSEMLELTYQAAKDNQADIVLFGGFRYDEKQQKLINKPDFLRRDLLPNQTVFSWIDLPDNLFALSNISPWSKLYSRYFLLNTGLKFQTMPNNNDFYFVLSSMALAKRITFVNSNLLFHRINCHNYIIYNDSTPIYFLSAIESLYRELVQYHLYGPLQTTFRHQALAYIISNLKNAKNDKRRLDILNALDNEPFCDLPLYEIPENDNSNTMVHRYSAQLSAAQLQYHKSLKVNAAMKELSKLSQKSETDNSIKVSVIIPIFNTETYLNETLASIADQTLSDIEIICIDDGSTDNSLSILNHWADIDKRFIIISESNIGQGFARNVGIAHSRGEYLYFMDSDDLLEKDALKQLTTIMDEKYLDSLYFDADTFFENDNLKKDFNIFQNNYRRSQSYDEVYDGPTLMRLFCEEDKYRVNVYLQLHRRTFIIANKIYFPGVVHDDNAFTFAAMLNAKRVSHIQHPYIKRRIRSSSLMTQSLSFKSVYGYYRDVMTMFIEYYKNYDALSIVNRSAAIESIYKLLFNAQNEYARIPSDEINSELGILDNLITFKALVGRAGDYSRSSQQLSKDKSNIDNEIKKLKSQIKTLKEQNNIFRQESENIRASISFRLGRALTFPARWIRDKFHHI